MPRTRTFIAVELSPDIRANAVALQELLAKSGSNVKWVGPEGMHITLLFLGEVDDRELPAVCRAVQDVAAKEPPFALRVSGVSAFPTPPTQDPLGGITDGRNELKRLYERLEAQLLDLGCYRKEERGYTPHLTLGRAKSEADGFALSPELTGLRSWDGGRANVDEVLVVGSVLERSGPVYTIIGRGRLQGQ